MKRSCLITTLITALASQISIGEEGFVPLFNGKTLEGWSAAKSLKAGEWGSFSVDEKEKAIHVYAGVEAGAKEQSDCLVSDKAYSKYILTLEYKWLEKRFDPRGDWDRDAGLLFHVHGDLKKVWPLSLEMQMGESDRLKKHGKNEKGRFHTGDLFVLGKDLRVTTNRDEKGYWDPEGKTSTGRSGPTKLGVEKAHGEWNKMEIHVDGAKKAVFILNGEKVFEITDFTQKKDGETIPLEKGHIGLQAEWAELLYRNILIKEL